MRIAVIGAGIGGLTVAAGLQADGHHVELFEKSSQPSPTGAGLTLFGNAFTALDALGLGEQVRQVSSAGIASMRSGQRHPSGKWLATMPASSTVTMRSVLRAELHRVLLENLGGAGVHWDAEAVVADNGEPLIAVNGQVQHFDLVVAADGIRSRSRTLLGLDTGLRYAGCTAWRGITERSIELGGAAGETWGRGRIFGIVPLLDGRVYWFATLTTAAGTTFPDEHEAVRATFAGWHNPVADCIDATPRESLMRHDLYDLARPLRSFVHGRTVLLGDAAHAMTPNLGQGAGQAIEDAATLTLLLRGLEAGQLETALASYSAVRRKRTTGILLRSRTAGQVAQLENPVAVGLRNAALRITPSRVVGRMTEGMLGWTVGDR